MYSNFGFKVGKNCKKLKRKLKEAKEKIKRKRIQNKKLKET